jgi:hypothetical protein
MEAGGESGVCSSYDEGCREGVRVIKGR